MLARIHILLPYAFTIPEGEKYPIYEYEGEGYRVRVYPPVRSEKADHHTDAEEIAINGVKAFNADVLRIDFQRESFNRNEYSEYDPPLNFIKRVANDFLARLRYVTNASRVKLIEFPDSHWHVTYLNDDGTELPEEKGLIRGRGARKFEFSFIAVNNEVWESIHSLDPHQELPVWKNLLLDADAALPDIGPAIVLTFTALEVFISKVLDDLALAGKVDKDLWAWINQRSHFLKEPSIEERYDFLCRHLMGKSLKENGDLWEQFRHLQKARNSFVHDGIAKVGDEVVTSDRARNFIKKANEIIAFIKNELPEKLRWPEFAHKVKIQFRQTIFRADDKKRELESSGQLPEK